MATVATSHETHAEAHEHSATGIPNKKLFMWAFLASDCMFFGALISTHLIYRLHPPPGTPSPRDIFSIELTSFSTFILLMSSLLMALAVNSIEKGRVRETRRNLLGTILFGLIFLGCQVYEFEHFVHEKDLTLSNSIFGSTFYTLTGTHGCHVAIGVLWLVLMYIRTFTPTEDSGESRTARASRPWRWRAVAHFATFVVAIVAAMSAVLGIIHGKTYLAGVTAQIPAIAIALAGIGVLVFFARTAPRAVDFGKANAIDVESMGLYWHFVDIVWIVIFTALYLLEFI